MNQVLATAGVFVPALAIVAWAAHLLVVARRSPSWPTVDATIVASRVERPSNATRSHFEFTYGVDGRAYHGRRVAVGPAIATTGDGAERIVAAHFVGSHAAITYDPRDPSYGVLLRGVLPRHVVVAVAAAAAVVMSVGIAMVLAT